MALYAIGTLPLIIATGNESPPGDTDDIDGNEICDIIRSIWYVDDAGGAGMLTKLKKWWELIKKLGPSYGYFPKPSKCWLIVKPEFLALARELFQDINITTDGRPYLGSFIGTEDAKAKYVNEKVEEWVKEIS